MYDKIGIGITTYNRPECLAECKAQIAKHTKMDNVLIYVAEDVDQDRRGVAYRKNECLRALQHCDYIFLFDDDCFPIKNNWIDFFLGSGEKHLLFRDLRDKSILCIPGVNSKIEPHNNCGGVFMFFTKECVDKVGAFNENFTIWGFEHAEYSHRIRLAGLTAYHFLHLIGTEKYLYSKDYSDPKHKSSIDNEEKRKYFNFNLEKFRHPIENIYLPL